MQSDLPLDEQMSFATNQSADSLTSLDRVRVVCCVACVSLCVLSSMSVCVFLCTSLCNQSPDLYHGWLAVLPFCRGMLLHYELRSRRQWRVSAGYSNHLLRCQVNNPAKALSVVYLIYRTLHLVVYRVQLTI